MADLIIKAYAKMALDIQDACNLSGVVHSWSRALADLASTHPNTFEPTCPEWSKMGTAERNEHCINVLFADKVAHLTGTQTLGNDRVLKAYDEAHRIVEGA